MVTLENQKQPMVIIDERGEEENLDHSEKYDTIQPILVDCEPMSSSPN